MGLRRRSFEQRTHPPRGLKAGWKARLERQVERQVKRQVKRQVERQASLPAEAMACARQEGLPAKARTWQVETPVFTIYRYLILHLTCI